MKRIARGRPAGKPRRSPTPLSDYLCDLARRVERLGVGGRTDPEAIVLGKLGIAGELRQLAQELAA